MTHVYVANSDSQDIATFRAGADGVLQPLATLAVQTPAQPGRSMLLAVSPDRTRLYAGYPSGAQYRVSTFAIDAADGMPRPLAVTALADAMAYMVPDRAGRTLLCASYGGNRVTANAIDPGGCVGALLQDIATEPKAHCVITDAANRHVLHTSLGGDCIYQQRFDAASGRLAPNDPPLVRTAPKSGPRFLVLGRDERFLYVNGELDGTVSVYPYDAATGTLGPCVQTLSLLPPGFAGNAWAADLVLSPDGRTLYTSERTSSTVGAFAVDAGSGLVRLIGLVPAVRQPRALAIDPAGRFLVAAGQLSNSVLVYSIDPASGALRALAEYPVGRNPTWIIVAGSGP